MVHLLVPSGRPYIYFEENIHWLLQNYVNDYSYRKTMRKQRLLGGNCYFYLQLWINKKPFIGIYKALHDNKLG